jgi:hypothetical protein
VQTHPASPLSGALKSNGRTVSHDIITGGKKKRFTCTFRAISLRLATRAPEATLLLAFGPAACVVPAAGYPRHHAPDGTEHVRAGEAAGEEAFRAATLVLDIYI